MTRLDRSRNSQNQESNLEDQESNSENQDSAFRKAWNVARKVIGATGLLICADLVFSEGHYGGGALDSVGKHEGANTYRAVGIVASKGVGFMWDSTVSLGSDINDLGQKYGQPRP